MFDATFDSAERTIDSPIGATQIELEQLYSKYQLMPTLRQEFEDAEFPHHIESLGIPVDFGMDLLVTMHLHKRLEPAALIGILRKHFIHEEKPAQACANMIMKAAEKDLVNFDLLRNQLIVIYEIQGDILNKLEQFQYPLPMIEEPSKVTHNKQTGYRTIRKSIILKKNHHDNDVCLDHINRINAQPLSVNPNVVAFVQNAWKNIDKRKDGETDEEFAARKKAFEKYDRTSREVLEALMVNGNGVFYLTHAYDKRGRTYAQGYHVNYQGNDWNKACIQLANAEKLT
jgi:hypothetical protein